MKQILVLIAFVSSFATSALAHEPVEKSKTIRLASLIDFNIDHEWLREANQGYVEINYTDNIIHLNLMDAIVCPEGDACIAISIAPAEVLDINLPIVDTYTDACGAVHTLAEADDTPTDGMHQIVEVIDYSYMICEIAVKNMTEVVYRTYNPWTGQRKVQLLIKSYL